jgi:N-acetylneuraminate synthase
MSTLGEVETALGILGLGYLFPNEKPSLERARKIYCSNDCQNILKNNVILLHCTTEYPAPYKSVNLRMMDTLKNAFDLPVGLSDHTLGIAVSIAAAARGAVMIEKHFTIDREMNGPDHKASLEPLELNEMVKGIRAIEDALGNTIKIPASAELKNIPKARRSLTAQTNIIKGETFTKNNLITKRPATGKSSIHYWEWLGKIATRDYVEDELID